MYRVIGALTAIVIAGAVGFWYGSGQGKTVTVEKEVVRTETQWKDHIVTIVKTVKPDGTIEEKTVTEEKEGTVKKEKDSVDTHVTPSLAQYSLGVRYQSSYSELVSRTLTSPGKGVEVSAGRRILGPLWGELGVGMERVTLGIRYEF